MVLGVGCRIGDRLPQDVAWVFNLGAPWLAIAFGLGAGAKTLVEGGARGALAMAAAVVAYYVFASFFEKKTALLYPTALGALWLPVAVGGGAVFGTAGVAWRTRGPAVRVVSVALLAGVLIGEAGLMLLRPGHTGDFMFGAEWALGLVLPFVMLRKWREQAAAFVLAVGVSGLAFVVEQGLRLATR